MARLVQESSDVPDARQITISLWYKITDTSLEYDIAPDTPIPIIEIGDFSHDTLQLGSGIWWLPRRAYLPFELLDPDDETYPALVFQVLGQTGSVNIGDCLSGDWVNSPFSLWTQENILDGAPPGWNEGNSFWMVGKSMTPFAFRYYYGGTSIEPPNFVIGQWQHVMFAVDTDFRSLGNAPTTTGPLIVPYINGYEYGTPDQHNLPANLIATADDWTEKYGPFDYEAGNGEEVNAFGGISLSAIFPDTHVGGDWSYVPTGLEDAVELGPFAASQMDVPAFDIAINGKTISIPGGSHQNPNYKIQMADVQIWVGQFIDPRDHIEKFFRRVGETGGRPVNPAVAAAAFGTPTFLFKGSSSSTGFQLNRGTGGAFVKTGTLTDQSGPSF